MENMDELIKKYADRLQYLYDNHTVGEHTFTGVLAQMLWEIKENPALCDALMAKGE